MPKLAIAVVVLALAALAGTLSYAGFLVVGVVSDHLNLGRFMTGLLLCLLFARIPWKRQGKFRFVGLLPKSGRLPAIVSLLALSLLTFLHRGDMVPMVFVGLAATFLLTHRWLRRKLLDRLLTAFLGSAGYPPRQGTRDENVIDVEVRERKD